MYQPKLLLTRPLLAARRFLASCEAALGRPIPSILSPVLAIRPVEVGVLGRPSGLILTSENGARRAGELGLSGLPAWCVGPRTAAVAAEAGLSTIEAGPDAENLVARLTREAPTGPLLHLRGEHIRGDIASRLRLAGLEVQDAVAYRQEPLSPTVEARVALDGDDPLVAPLFSSRSAVLLSAWTPAAPLHVIALSAAVALAARPLHPASLEVASLPRGEAMVEMTLRALAACDRTAT